MRNAIIILPLLLAACGGGDGIEKQVRDPETGETTTVRAGSGVKAPDNLPVYAPIYRGATIETSITNGAGAGKGLISFSVTEDPQTIIDFYRKRGADAGLKVMTEATVGGARMLAMGGEGDGSAAMQVTVTTDEEEAGLTRVSLVYVAPDGDPPEG
ncbi:hypothetical protein [Sphingomonas sp.]|uniref:hypothetical protein n=1 Tax=Sphingomonas sp. TaxID=28214 RepID=UPI001EC3BC4E|nr:hypothetical protein [Sphingomonas sp.]MBX3595894.1 hypothetical protein [Sphingomonas sp.]